MHTHAIGVPGVFRILALVAVLTVLAGCGGSGKAVSRSDYGNAWPLTVDKGRVDCKNEAVTFTTPDGTVYALNGFARTIAAKNGWQNIRSIWANDPTLPGTKKDIGVLIDAGLKLCGS